MNYLKIYFMFMIGIIGILGICLIGLIIGQYLVACGINAEIVKLLGFVFGAPAILTFFAYVWNR